MFYSSCWLHAAAESGAGAGVRRRPACCVRVAPLTRLRAGLTDGRSQHPHPQFRRRDREILPPPGGSKWIFIGTTWGERDKFLKVGLKKNDIIRINAQRVNKSASPAVLFTLFCPDSEGLCNVGLHTSLRREARLSVKAICKSANHSAPSPACDFGKRR